MASGIHRTRFTARRGHTPGSAARWAVEVDGPRAMRLIMCSSFSSGLLRECWTRQSRTPSLVMRCFGVGPDLEARRRIRPGFQRLLQVTCRSIWRSKMTQDPTTARHWFKDHWKLLMVGVVWLALLATLVIWGVSDRASAQGTAEACAGVDQQGTGIPAEPPEQPAQLQPRAESNATIAFYQDLRPAKRDIEYDVTDPDQVLHNGNSLEVRAGGFVSLTGSRELRPDNIHAMALVEHGSVVLMVCFDRTDPGFGRPGIYSGIISINDPRVTRVDANFTVSMSYPWWQFVFAILVLMMLFAVLYVWLLRGSFSSQGRLKPTHLQEWLFSRTGLMSMGAGIAAAVGIFSAIYARAEDWGSDYTAATALFGATFTAFVAAATAPAAAGLDEQSPKTAKAPTN